MNILLLNPPSRNNTIMVKEGRCMQRKGAWGYMMAPVTMVTIATLLRNCGHTVTVIDCPAERVNFAAMLASVCQITPDIIFINTSTPTIDDDLHAAHRIKKNCPDPPVTALFGIHPSCRYAELLQPDSGIDVCIIGEPEFTARDFAEAIRTDADLHMVAGIAFLDTSGKLAVTTPREMIANLDDLPIPDWSLVDTGNYRLPLNNEKFLLVNTNRGCPYYCTFCNACIYYGRTPRRRSVNHIMEEIKTDVDHFGVTNFMFWAEEFILNKSFVLELCNAINNSGLNIQWVCNSRVDAADTEILTAIRKAGCWNIAFGIESGVQEILDAVTKGITLAQIRSAVSMAKQVGLQVTGHVIIGFPMDTHETIAATGQFIDSLELDFVQYYCAMPYPGTALYNDALENGWLTTTEWRHWEHNSSVLSYPQLSAAEIMKLRRRLMLHWYFTPKRIINTVKNHVKRPSDLWALLAKLGGFIRWM